MRRLPRWLGTLLSPADDPRRGVATHSTPVLLDELQRSRRELAQLRQQIQTRAPQSPVAEQLAEEERELLEAESTLLLQMDECRAQAALLRAADARVRAET